MKARDWPVRTKPVTQMQDSAEISVIVVNYGTADLARAAVDSVLAHDHDGRKVDVHLVDNASPGQDREILAEAARSKAWRGRVTFYPEMVNHGFGRGNNLVLRVLAARPTPPDKVFLLNPDARLDNEAIAILADAMDADPTMGFAGAGISKPGSGPVVAAFRLPGLISEVVSTLGVGPLARLAQHWQVPLPPDHPEGPVGWVAGAAVLARFHALREMGFFDDAFFLYYEEVDLMRRADLAGWKIHYVPRARVIHAEGAATGVRSGETVRRRRPAYWYQSWAYYFLKARGRVGAAGLAVAVLLASVLHFPLSGLRRRPPALPLHFLGDFWSVAVWPLLRGQAPISWPTPPVQDAPTEADTDPFRVNPGTANCNPLGIGFWALVREDFRTNDSDLLSQGFWALFWHRFGNWRMEVRPKLLRAPLSVIYGLMYKMCQWFGGIMLPYTVRVGRRVRLDHFGGMILVAQQIGNDVIIRQNTTFGIARLDDSQGRPVIGDGVEIGAGAVILGRIRVGDRATIGANAVVTKPVPDRAVMGGVPARLIRIVEAAE
ncbi:glycosyltransferase [Rhodovulum marinum]|uniref:GT2 family glycosyltransferase n=1 Tax=Rhodovulum marinum TaxID=320662 RepID=A0A4R2PWM8_9RHOB|nr:glycosyltransferase [Rhodovulum marinum]TCP39578.1 GT2 family glycosyltransferase [Rhodovulum marinum]